MERPAASGETTGHKSFELVVQQAAIGHPGLVWRLADIFVAQSVDIARESVAQVFAVFGLIWAVSATVRALVAVIVRRFASPKYERQDTVLAFVAPVDLGVVANPPRCVPCAMERSNHGIAVVFVGSTQHTAESHLQPLSSKDLVDFHDQLLPQAHRNGQASE